MVWQVARLGARSGARAGPAAGVGSARGGIDVQRVKRPRSMGLPKDLAENRGQRVMEKETHRSALGGGGVLEGPRQPQLLQLAC